MIGVRQVGGRSAVRVLIAMLAAITAWSILPAAAQAAFPGTNGKLAFGSARNGFPADNDLYTMASDGAAQTRITSLSRDELNAAWNPAGTRIAYERNKGMNSDIWVANADGTAAYQLTNDPDTDARPAWSNTGKKIVFASDRAGTPGVFDLFVVDTNAKNLINLTNTPAISEEYPSWSADGSAIAFSRDGDIYKMAPNGSNLRQLTSAAVMEIEPDWHPTGGQIVYRTGINGTDNIWRMNADGTGQVALVNNGSTVEERPVWSPQGDKIAFIRGAFKDADVYTMNSDGTGVTRVTNNTLMDASPAWQPIPLPASYVRPKTAAQSQFALVPAFRPCNVPNRVHGPPLENQSCSPPKQYSRYLTVGTSDVNGAPTNLNAFVKVTGLAGITGNQTDEADISVQVRISDVRNKADLTDYTGQLRVRAELRRQTDKENAVGTASPVEAATSTDAAWSFSVQCAATADATIGSNCDLTTTRDAITPGSIKEGKRLVLELGRIQVWDGGSDGQNSTQVNDLFLTQGVFVP
jgi:WD40 repeat protein